MKKKTTMILAALAVVLVLAAVAWLALGKDDAADVPQQTTATVAATEPRETISLSASQQSEYEQLIQCLDTGDSKGFAQLLLDGQVSRQTFEALVQEDRAAVEHMLADALVAFCAEGNLEPMVKLTENDCLWESCFRACWEMIGSEEPEETGLTAKDCLVYELCFAYRRDSYTLRSLRELWQSGTLSQELHQALVAALGFDYTDDTLVEEQTLAPLGDLTQAEKSAYESALASIDQGDGSAIVAGLLDGSLTEAVYRKLMAQDEDVLDYIIAQGLAGQVEEGEYLPLIQLRQGGFVSDACFKTYWEFLDTAPYAGKSKPDGEDGVDMYLVYELKQLSQFGNMGIDMLREIWRSGILTDDVQNRLVEELGFDYTVTYGG